jgi:hypothetical protein
MRSEAFRRCSKSRALGLDQIENAHASVGGTERGRRYATDQINQAYAVLLASQFQGFCRDLHSESVDYLVDILEPPSLRPIVRAELTRERKLDKGNATPGNLGDDFGRLGIEFWAELKKLSAKSTARNQALEMLNHWRNAIAHQNFDPSKLGATKLGLVQVRNWRIACDRVALASDRVMRNHIRSITGKFPWKSEAINELSQTTGASFSHR